MGGELGHVDDQRLQISMVPKMLGLEVRLDRGAQQLDDVAHHYLAEIVIGIEAEVVLEYFGFVSIYLVMADEASKMTCRGSDEHHR